MFDPSCLSILPQPWRYTTQPVLDDQGNEVVPGVKQVLEGVFILLDESLVREAEADGLTATQKSELRSWVERYTPQQLAEWHVPCWAGENGAVIVHVPKSIWNDSSLLPSLKVRRAFRKRWREPGA